MTKRIINKKLIIMGMANLVAVATFYMLFKLSSNFQVIAEGVQQWWPLPFTVLAVMMMRENFRMIKSQ